MKTGRSRSRLPRGSRGLSVFAGDSLEAYDTLVERAQKRLHEIKDMYRGQTMSFEYRNELLAGRFIDAVEGSFPGTYMVILQLPSSRTCNGPCFVHIFDERLGAIVVTSRSGQVGITLKALPQHRVLAVPFDIMTACCK